MERASSNPLPRMPTPAGAASGAHSGTGTPSATTNPSTPSANPNLLDGSDPAFAQAFAAPVVGHVDPVVYVVFSPNGPRALLLNNSDTFYTPRTRRRRNDASSTADTEPNRNNPPVTPGFPEYRNRGLRPRRAHRNRRENNAPLPVNGGAAHANPGAGALAAQIGPILWLIVRLVGFVWFFTAGNPSWTRWLMVSALAIVVFIINTGVANGVFEQLWGPIRRHVEALIPLAGPEAAQIPAINAAIPRPPPAEEPPANDQAAANAGAQRRRGELDPAQVAAHLLEQHRLRNGPGWLMTQIRRAEHSMLLFLASLVPGVGERHIAAREAEANAAEADRQRRIDEAAAAAAAAAENATDADGEQTGEGAVEGSVAPATDGRDENAGEQHHNGGEAPAPLVDI
jgi:uncharacterized MAPEG superfamily protein